MMMMAMINAALRFPFLCLQLTCTSDYNSTSSSQEADANLALKGLGANLQMPAREKPVVPEEEGQRVYGAGRSHPPALVASGAV